MVLRAALSFAVGVTLTGVPVVLGQADTDVPSPDVLVSRAWAEAGGLEAFNDLGILLVDVTSEETTQQGTASTGTTKTYFAAPGPVPGRIEMDKPPVLAGDDGSGRATRTRGRGIARRGRPILPAVPRLPLGHP